MSKTETVTTTCPPARLKAVQASVERTFKECQVAAKPVFRVMTTQYPNPNVCQVTEVTLRVDALEKLRPDNARAVIGAPAASHAAFQQLTGCAARSRPRSTPPALLAAGCDGGW